MKRTGNFLKLLAKESRRMKNKSQAKVLPLVLISLIFIGGGIGYFVFAQGSFDETDNRTIGYEFLDLNGNITNASYGKVVHIWNTQDDYFFNKSSGIQFTNHFQDYWTRNIFCIGYYSGEEWIKIKCVDELDNFNKEIQTDNETYVNATLWKDIEYNGYDLRLGINYYLGLNDENLSITIYAKNIGIDIPYDLGFAWKVKDIEIPYRINNDSIFINDTQYYLNENVDLLFKNMTKIVQKKNIIGYENITNQTTGENETIIIFEIINVTEEIPFFKIVDGKELRLDWNENLKYAVKMYGDGNQENFYVALLINVGHFNPNQEKSTIMYWIDAPVTDAHGITLGSSGTTDAGSGFTIETNAAVTLTKVTKQSNVGAGYANIYDYSDDSLIDSAAFVGDDATFSLALADATKYYVLLDDGGAGHDYLRYHGAASYPYAGTNIDWTSGARIDPSTLVISELAGWAYNVQSITSEETGADSTPPTYSNAQTNTTVAGEPVNFSILYDDDTALHPGGQYIFSTNNTGTWVNDTTSHPGSQYEIFFEGMESTDWVRTSGNAPADIDCSKVGLFNGCSNNGGDYEAGADSGSAQSGTYGLTMENWDNWNTQKSTTGIWYTFDPTTACDGGPCDYINMTWWWHDGGEYDNSGEYMEIIANDSDQTDVLIKRCDGAGGAIQCPSSYVSAQEVNLSASLDDTDTLWTIRFGQQNTGTAEEARWDNINITGYYTAQVEEVNFTTTSQWANVTKVLNLNSGTVVGYRWYADDNVGNVNNTEVYIVTTTSVDTCTYTSGNWEVDCSDYCNITSNVEAGGNNIIVSGTGIFTVRANITADSIAWTSGCKIINVPGDGNELRIAS